MSRVSIWIGGLAWAAGSVFASPAAAQSVVEKAALAETARIERSCAADARKAGIVRKPTDRQQGWRTVTVLDDGPAVHVIDSKLTRCADVSQLICGTGGCPHSIIIGLPGGRSKIIRETALSFRFTNPGERNLLEMRVHGTRCGLAGSAVCSVNYDLRRSGRASTAVRG
jgi:hypothetical protein